MLCENDKEFENYYCYYLLVMSEKVTEGTVLLQETIKVETTGSFENFLLQKF